MSPEILNKLERFFSNYPKRLYPKGQILIFGDQDPENIFYIIKGKVREYDISYRGDEVIVNIFKSPAFFPMAWAINRNRNQFFYKTETTTELRIVPADDTVAFLKENPDVMFDLLSRLYSGVDSILARVVHLMSGTAKSRLVYELVIECRRFGVQSSGQSYLLETKEGDLAARSGLSRETISREMKALKKRNIISIDNHGILVNDLSALEAMLEQ